MSIFSRASEGVHTGTFVETRRQMRVGHQSGACKYTVVWMVSGRLVFQICDKDPGLLPAQQLLSIEWPNMATPCNNPLWMWA